MVTSLNSILDKCGKGLSLKKVRTALLRFERMGFLANESTTTERLITICNWENYQSHVLALDRDTDSQQSGDGQTSIKQGAANKNVKNVKNEKNVKKRGPAFSSFKSFEEKDIESARGVNGKSLEGFLNAD